MYLSATVFATQNLTNNDLIDSATFHQVASVIKKILNYELWRTGGVAQVVAANLQYNNSTSPPSNCVDGTLPYRRHMSTGPPPQFNHLPTNQNGFPRALLS